MGAQLIAEGTADRPIVFTSRFDDRYGAGGTFDTSSDAARPAILARGIGVAWSHDTFPMSIDHALITFGGGVTSVAGGFSGFNAVEIHQAEVRWPTVAWKSTVRFGRGRRRHRDGHGATRCQRRSSSLAVNPC